MIEGFIEPASLQDLEIILDLQRLAFRQEGERYEDFSIPPLIETLKEVTKAYEKQVFFKYVIKTDIVGSIRGYINERGVCLIGRLAVHPEYRRQGVGERLVQHMIDYFQACREFEIFTGDQSKPAISLYGKLGFVLKERKDAGSHNLVIMVKPN